MNRKSFIGSLLGLVGMGSVKTEDYGISSDVTAEDFNGLVGFGNISLQTTVGNVFDLPIGKHLSFGSPTLKDPSMRLDYGLSVEGKFLIEDEETGCLEVRDQTLYFKEGEALSIGGSDYILLDGKWAKLENAKTTLAKKA